MVDYFITQIDSMKYFKNMYVLPVHDLLTNFSIIPTSTVPEHSLLLLDTDFSEFNLLNQEDKRHIFTQKLPFNDLAYASVLTSVQLSNIPKHFMSEGPIVKDICKFLKCKMQKKIKQN